MAQSYTRHITDAHQRQFVKLFETVCQRHNRWTVFTDFVHMAAIAVSNTVDKVHAENREKTYMQMEAQYSKKELDCIRNMFAELVLGLDVNTDQDFMGGLFMNLELGNQYRGQFFTPYCIGRLMAEMTAQKDIIDQKIEKRGWISVNDCCCGAGGLLVAFANTCLRFGVNYQTSVLFTAQDLDTTAAFMCYLQLSLLGCPGYVVIGNTITNPARCLDRRALIPAPNQEVWYTPFYFREVWHYRRIWAQMDMLFDSAVTENKAPTDNNPQPQNSKGKKPKAKKISKASTEKPVSPINSTPAEPEIAAITINLSETKTGQLTFF